MKTKHSSKFMTALIIPMMLTVISACVIPISAAESNLLMHFKMDGGDFAKDECGNAQAEVYGEILSETGKFGDAAYFNGSDSYMWVKYPDAEIQKCTMTF